MRVFLFMVFLSVSSFSFGQTKNSIHNKGSFFFYWGYNRAAFTNSDITFTGNGYDFTLKNVSANDRPTAFTFKEYFGITSLWTPQYLTRIGYFVSDQWAFSLGFDHMKYVMNSHQKVGIEGTIDQPNNPYNGTYSSGSQIDIAPKFLQFEHTDGLNYINFSADYFFKKNILLGENITVQPFVGAGFGIVVPKTNVTLMSGERNDEFHLSGIGGHVDGGFQITFWQHLFLRSKATAGGLWMYDILTRPGNASDRAEQHIGFLMCDFVLGYQWRF